jgi:hypothetical protein
LEKLIETKGFDIESPLIKKYFDQCTDVKSLLEAVEKDHKGEDNVIYRVLDGRLAVDDFNSLCEDLKEIYREVLPNKVGYVNNLILSMLTESNQEKQLHIFQSLRMQILKNLVFRFVLSMVKL